MAQFNYVPDTNDQYQGFEPLPAGEYKVQITDSDIVTPKSGNGSMIKFSYEVVADPQFDGRKIFDNIIFHPLTLKFIIAQRQNYFRFFIASANSRTSFASTVILYSLDANSLGTHTWNKYGNIAVSDKLYRQVRYDC